MALCASRSDPDRTCSARSYTASVSFGPSAMSQMRQMRTSVRDPNADVGQARRAWSASDPSQMAFDYGRFAVGSMIPAASWITRLSFHAFCLWLARWAMISANPAMSGSQETSFKTFSP